MKIKSHGNLYLSFSFISVIVFETSGVFREKGKEMGLNACCQMPNIQPTRSMGKEQKKSIKTIIWLYRSLLDTLLFFKAKIWSAGEERTFAGHGAVCFAVPACKRCVCVQSLRRYAYRQSIRHPCPCGSQPTA